MYRNIFTRKAIAWLQIILQLAIPFFSVLPASANDHPTTALPDSDILTSAATTLAENNTQNIYQQVQSGLINKATSQASSTAEQWLNHFGTARVQLDVDQNGHWDQSSVDLLSPLYDNKKSVLFTQLGLRAPDSRVTGNMGFGVRTFYLNNWMFGANAFFDDDFTGHNRRFGIGAEAWTNYLKLSANTYIGTTQWHDSRDFDDYEEKPSDGFDIRAEGYLPAKPQLGAKVVYEQYYGNQVALFDTDHLQNNPSAVTLGVNYTPVPLVTVGANYRRGQDDMDDLQFQLEFHYDFDHDWRYQVSSENVALERSLAGSRYDLVERNNQIVMQYRKKAQAGVGKLVLQTIADNSAADGVSRNQLQVQVLSTKGEVMPNENVQWRATGQAKLDTTTSVTDANGVALVNITDTSSEATDITATSGSVSAQTQSHFSPVVPATLTLSIDKNGSQADGVATDDATVTILDSNHHALAGAAVNWSVTTPGTLRDGDAKTDGNGVAHAHISSTVSGTVTLTASSATLSQQKALVFVADSQKATITRFDVTVDRSPADGSSADRAIIEVRDPAGNPVRNTPVTLSTDSTTLAFGTGARQSSSTRQTDMQGQVNLQFTDTVAETVQLTATLNNGNSKNASATFVADSASAVIQSLTVTKAALANGVATNSATVTVVDAHKNPLAQTRVRWQVTGSAQLSDTASKTDENGKVTVTLTDTVAQKVTLTATLDNGQNASADSLFLADASSAHIALSLSHDGSLADGATADTIDAIVTDGQGNPLPAQAIAWRTGSSTAQVPASSNTDLQGHSQIAVTDTKGEKVTVTATLVNRASASIDVSFISYQVTQLSPDVTRQQADGHSVITFTAMMTDNNGKPAGGQPVSFTTTGSATLSSPEAITNASGTATVTLTDSKEEDVTVMAKSKTYTGDAGKSSTVSFVADHFTGITANGYHFDIADHFPTIGMLYASFTLEINGSSANNANYTWSTDASWIRIKTPGVVSIVSTATGRTATITATPVSGTGAPLTYSFTLKHWLLNIGRSTDKPETADSDCAGHSGVVPGYSIFSSGGPEEYGARGIGSLYGEWGDPSKMMGGQWSTSSPAESMWAAETGVNGTRIYVHWRDGYVNDRVPSQVMDEVCLIY